MMQHRHGDNGLEYAHAIHGVVHMSILLSWQYKGVVYMSILLSWQYTDKVHMSTLLSWQYTGVVIIHNTGKVIPTVTDVIETPGHPMTTVSGVV